MIAPTLEAYDYREIRVHVAENGVASVVMDRPDRLNAVGEVLHTELSLVFRQLARDPAVRVVVLSGAGRAFSAGGDLDFMQEMIDRPALFETVTREAQEIVFSLIDCEKPVLAKVNGDAVGLGATLALFCDVIFMAQRARIGDPHVRVGLVTGDGGAAIWPLLIGQARAKELLLTGDLLDAEAASRLGLVNHVLAPKALDTAVDAFAARLAQGAQQAIRWTKASVNIGLRQAVAPILQASLAFEAITNLSADHQEAVTAFVEKRAPVFL